MSRKGSIHHTPGHAQLLLALQAFCTFESSLSLPLFYLQKATGDGARFHVFLLLLKELPYQKHLQPVKVAKNIKHNEHADGCITAYFSSYFQSYLELSLATAFSHFTSGCNSLKIDTPRSCLFPSKVFVELLLLCSKNTTPEQLPFQLVSAKSIDGVHSLA